MNQNNHVVEIVMADISNRTNENQKKSYIVPGHTKVKNEDDITWEARDSNATFFFPKPEIFGITDKEHEVAKGDSLTFTISSDAKSGKYPYAVYTENDDFAEGGSFPRIIIS